jgi:pimeloyl-ACP methyl ester carboxylesterase
MEYQASGNGTIMRAGGPDRAERTVLCLPGGLCTAAFFDDLFAEPAIEHGDVRLLATTLPGFGGVPLPTGFDASVESHAERAANLAGRRDATPCSATASAPTSRSRWPQPDTSTAV